MTNNVNRLIRLLQQILEFRKAENGNLKLKVSQGELVGFIKNSIDSIEPLMHKKNIKCSFLCEEEKINGFFDIDKLDKILYNLLSNAAKYNNNGNLVEVLLSLEDNNTIAVIEVKDNGEGFTS